VATQQHPSSTGGHDEEHLRRFLRARAHGDAAEMRRWWDELVIDVHDRMDGLVYAAHRGRLDDEEHELAVQLAMIKFATNLMTTFAGVSMGQLVNAARTLARGVCIDVQRRAVRERRAGEVSLDEARDRDDAGEAGTRWEADEARRRLADEEDRRDVVEFLAWALPQVPETRRRVLELTVAGAELAEICTELGIARDNAYQRRSRGLKDLAALRERYDG
jgi:RNA polymerase sigma factor (sigma-70 family)